MNRTCLSTSLLIVVVLLLMGLTVACAAPGFATPTPVPTVAAVEEAPAAAIAPSDTAPLDAASGPALEGAPWLAVALTGAEGSLESVLPGTSLTAMFADGNLTGSAGCNDYNTTYEVDGAAIKFEPVATTRKMCNEPDGVMEQETAYTGNLAQAAAYVVENGKLDLFDASGSVLITYLSMQPVDGLATSLLGNMAYQSSWVESGQITLTDGLYVQSTGEGETERLLTQLTDMTASGELDGVPSTAVVLSTNTGGSGVFVELALVQEVDGVPTNVASTQLGDRVVVYSVNIEDNMVLVEMVRQGPNDPMCCPTEHVMVSYELQNGELVMTGEQVLGTVPPPAPSEAMTTTVAPAATEVMTGTAAGEAMTDTTGLSGVVWEWLGTTAAKEAKPKFPEKYTLEFLPDGKAKLRVDCNAGGGAYVLDGDKLSFDVATLTRKACPRGSLGPRFVKELNLVAGYVLADDQLRLSLESDAGEMAFRPQAAVEQIEGTAPEMAAPEMAAPEPTPAPAAEATPVIEEAPVAGDTAVVTGTAAGPQLTGIVWEWLGTKYSNNKELIVKWPSRYSVSFMDEGSLQVKADCNTGAGSYEVDGSSLSIEVTAMTLAACEPGSRGEQFVDQLNQAASLVFDDENLVINLKADTGAMVLQPAP